MYNVSGEGPPLRCSGAPLESGSCPLLFSSPEPLHQNTGSDCGQVGRGVSQYLAAVPTEISGSHLVWNQCLCPSVPVSFAYEMPRRVGLQERGFLGEAFSAPEDTFIFLWADLAYEWLLCLAMRHPVGETSLHACTKRSRHLHTQD